MTKKKKPYRALSLFDYLTVISAVISPFLILSLLVKGLLFVNFDLKAPISTAFLASLALLYFVNDKARKLDPETYELNPLIRFLEKHLPWWILGFISFIAVFILLPLYLSFQSGSPPLIFLTDFIYIFAFLLFPSTLFILIHDTHTLYKIKRHQK